MSQEIVHLVDHLQLSPHQESGYYKRIYTSSQNFATAIYYLLPGSHFSAWHKIKSDEMWFYQLGASLNIYVIDASGTLQLIKLGNPLLEKDAKLQFCVTGNQWFCATSNDPKGYTLSSCVVVPGFDFKDWQLAERAAMLAEYPQHSEIIKRFTRS